MGGRWCGHGSSQSYTLITSIIPNLRITINIAVPFAQSWQVGQCARGTLSTTSCASAQAAVPGSFGVKGESPPRCQHHGPGRRMGHFINGVLLAIERLVEGLTFISRGIGRLIAQSPVSGTSRCTLKKPRIKVELVRLDMFCATLSHCSPSWLHHSRSPDPCVLELVQPADWRWAVNGVNNCFVVDNTSDYIPVPMLDHWVKDLCQRPRSHRFRTWG